jgi:hypothetical protein
MRLWVRSYPAGLVDDPREIALVVASILSRVLPPVELKEV